MLIFLKTQTVSQGGNALANSIMLYSNPALCPGNFCYDYITWLDYTIYNSQRMSHKFPSRITRTFRYKAWSPFASIQLDSLQIW